MFSMCASPVRVASTSGNRGHGSRDATYPDDRSLVHAYTVKTADRSLRVLLVNDDPGNSHIVGLSYCGFAPGSTAPTVSTLAPPGTSITAATSGSATSPERRPLFDRSGHAAAGIRRGRRRRWWQHGLLEHRQPHADRPERHGDQRFLQRQRRARNQYILRHAGHLDKQ